MSWVGLRGAVGIFIASIPLLVGVPNAQLYFDVGFVVVLVSLLVQGWTIAPAARALQRRRSRAAIRCRAGSSSICRASSSRRSSAIRSSANSPYLRRGLLPTWARPTLVVRDERILSPAEAEPLRRGRLHLPAGAAGEGAGARPLLCRHAAAGAAGPAAARRFLRHRRPHARRAGGNLRAVHRAGGDRHVARRFHRRPHRAHADARATSCRSAPSRWWCSGSPRAASPPSACGWRRNWSRETPPATSDRAAQARRCAALWSRIPLISTAAAQDRDAVPRPSSAITASTPNTVGDPLRRQHLARRAVGNQPAAIHDHDAVGEARGQRQVMHDREHRAAVVRGARQQLHHHELVARIERHRRLVGEQDRRFARQRARERHPRALAAGQRRDRPRGEGLRPGRGERAWRRPRGRRRSGARTHRHRR